MTEPKKNPNMALWSKVCTTKPEDTTQVKQRGGFTAINANSQICKATEVFGPCGKGWGWAVEYTVGKDAVVAQIDFWWSDSAGARHTFPSVGATALRDKYDKLDTDAWKKAQTDAVTKALSVLGFNHDIFRNWGCTARENKYIEDAPQQQATPQQQRTAPPENLEYKQQQQTMPAHTGNMSWMAEKFNFGKHKGSTWEWFSQGSPGGDRYSYMNYLAGLDPTNGDPKWHDKNRERIERCRIIMRMIDEGAGEMQDSEVQEREYLLPEDVDYGHEGPPPEPSGSDYGDADCPF